MYFAPDILVSSPDAHDIALVVEVQLRDDELGEAEQQLKRYMFGMRCPLGLLVTPERMRVFRDTYTSYGPESVELVGDYPIGGIFEEALARYSEEIDDAARAFRLEDAVQAWLERLAVGTGLTSLSPELRRALETYVLPALEQGEIRAAGPRARHGW